MRPFNLDNNFTRNYVKGSVSILRARWVITDVSPLTPACPTGFTGLRWNALSPLQNDWYALMHCLHRQTILSSSPTKSHTALIYSLDYNWLSERFYDKINSLWRLWSPTHAWVQMCHPHVAPAKKPMIKDLLLYLSIDFFITLIN